MANSLDPDQTIPENWNLTLIRLMRMANRVDPDQTAENDSADLDQNVENGKWCRT